MAIELVVFDIAGTTVDDGDAVNRCFRATLAAAGLDVSHAAANEVMGLPKPLAIRTLIERSAGQEALLARVDAIHSEFVLRMIRFYAEDPAVVDGPPPQRRRTAGFPHTIAGKARSPHPDSPRKVQWNES